MHSNLFDRAGSNPSRGAGEKNTFLGVVHQAILQSLTSSIRQPSLFSFWWDGSAKKLLHTWSRLGVTSSCYVSFPMCVWNSTSLGFLLRVLLWRTKRLQYKVKLRRLMRLWMALGIYKFFLNYVTPKFVSITESAKALGLWPANGRLLWRATPLMQRHSLIWYTTYG